MASFSSLETSSYSISAMLSCRGRVHLERPKRAHLGCSPRRAALHCTGRGREDAKSSRLGRLVIARARRPIAELQRTRPCPPRAPPCVGVPAPLVSHDKCAGVRLGVRQTSLPLTDQLLEMQERRPKLQGDRVAHGTFLLAPGQDFTGCAMSSPGLTHLCVHQTLARVLPLALTMPT